MATKFRATFDNGSWYVGEFQVSNGYFLGIVSDDCECQARAEAYAEEMEKDFCMNGDDHQGYE